MSGECSGEHRVKFTMQRKTSAGHKVRVRIGYSAITWVDRKIRALHASCECIEMLKARSNDPVAILARRRDATANAALSVGWWREDRV